jgi:tRNA A-37 threonylcarbamoyl transferase component Bud32/tetratricopeptide (TPR) repeat protein
VSPSATSDGEKRGGAADATLSADSNVDPLTTGPPAPEPVAVEVLARGATVGRYLVLERLGSGAMGIVYAAYDPELDRKIALKLLRPTQQVAVNQSRREARMVREAKAIAKVSHPNVVAIYDVGVHDGHVFMAMEHLAGGTLTDWMAPDKKRSWREIVKLFVEIGHGLAGAHAEGLIHRDFKPDNVLLDKNGKPKVVDFGLVRLSSGDLEDSGAVQREAGEEVTSGTSIAALAAIPPEMLAGPLTRTGALMGTPAYMAPEQFASKRVDERTDQFAFCVALYEALFGERPFPGETVIELASAVVHGRHREPKRDSQVPGWLRRAVLRGIDVNPNRRFPQLDELIAVLANDPAKRTRARMIGATALVVMLAAVGVAHRMGSRERAMCTGAGARLEGIWEPGRVSERKAAIHRAFAASGKSYAEQAFAGAARLLDQYVGRWTGMYTDACQATHVRGDQSAEVLDLRMSCLNEHLGNARALSDVFAAADGKVVENAISAAAALPSLDRCADVPLLRAVVKPPEDAATRKRVEDLRHALANLIALRDSGQCARATAKAGALISDVRAVGYQPLLADTLFESAQLGSNCGDIAETLQRLRDAHTAATESRNDEVAAQAAALIPSFAMNRFGQELVAREWMGVARGAVRRLGRETLADAMLAQAEGMLAASEGAFGRALAAADHSIAVTRRLLGPDDPLTIQWESNKGNWQETAGRLDEALQTDIQARTHFERVLGSEHPRVALVSNNEGEVLNLLGRYAEAEVAYERAVKLYRQSGVDADVLAWALTGLGRALVGQKRFAAAVAPLEEALAIRIEKAAPSAQLAETRFALARALWSRPAERQRALALGGSARRDCGDDKKAAAEIDAWLAGARTEGLKGQSKQRGKTETSKNG